MSTVTLESIKPLLDQNESTSISLYFPTHRHPTPDHIQEDKIRFKNLAKSGKEALEQQGFDSDEIRKIGNRLDEIYNQQEFWLETTEGTAVFATTSTVHVYHMPLECDEYVYVGKNFDISPLVALCSYDQPYYLLLLALHNPQLYKGDMNGIEKVDIELPGSPEEALNLDEPFINSQTQRARVVMGGGGSTDGNYARSSGGHGEGDTREVGNEERDAYFRIIDNKLLESEQFDSHLPLLLASATESEVAVFRNISKHKRILSTHLNGNLTNSRPKELHREAWLAVRKELGKERESETVNHFQEVVGQGKGSSEVSKIMEAATAGRVDTLLAGVMTVTRDTVRDDVEPVEKLIFSEAYTKDNLRDVMMKVFKQGGKIIALTSEQMTASAPIAAIYRY